MPIYENRRNAENRIAMTEPQLARIAVGLDAAVHTLADAVKNKLSGAAGIAVLCDGWYGVDYKTFSAALSSALSGCGRNVRTVSAAGFFKSPAEIAKQKHPWITDEVAFGRVNGSETLADYADEAATVALKKTISSATAAGDIVIVAGPGAVFGADKALRVYLDQTADPMLWKMWKGELTPFGSDAPRSDYGWKEYYYCDFYVMQRHKEKIIGSCDYYGEAIKLDALKLLPADVYKEMLAKLAARPIKQIRTYSPGPWGAYRYRDLWDIPGLRNNAWNRLAGADLSILAALGNAVTVNIPSVNLLLDHAAQFVGEFSAAHYPGLIPVEIWLDDGYFPEPQPAERTSMPIHNHPGTEYVKRDFNEPLGRYETYYIVEAYEGANTHMGFNEDASLEDWERLCRESWEKQIPIPDWRSYIANWPTNVGDLFLIPEGTTHGHGGNQMVLEMDTCGNAAGGEYSFFGYDFMRPTWDDEAGTMTGKPMKMHLDRYFAIDKCCRASYVRDHLRPRAKIVKWNQEFWHDRFDTLPQMPFEIERLHFTGRATHSTEGKYLHAMTLTVGESVVIRSLAHPECETAIERLQCALIPAGFGDYEVVNEKGGAATVVFWRLKKG